MFENIGRKIKSLAQFICWIGIAVSVVYGFNMMTTEYFTEMKLFGIVVIVFGSLLSWIGSFMLYGFGELIEKVTQIAENTAPQKTSPNGCAGADPNQTQQPVESSQEQPMCDAGSEKDES